MQNERKIPVHVAIIMDGNGRWAKKRGLPRTAGHAQGARVVEQILEDADHMGIRYLTVYAFSTENWSRPDSEVKALMNLLRTYMKTSLAKCARNNVRIRVIGDKSRLDSDLQASIANLEKETASNTGIGFQIAINYGSRDEIVRAVRKAAQKVKDSGLNPEDITEAMISDELDTAGIPDPDLLIRTGGEQRISNFLLWQTAYSELYFCDAKERVISGVVIAALIVGAGLLGGYPLAVLIMVCSMIGFQELARATAVLQSEEKVNTLSGFVLVMTAVYYAGLMAFQARWGSVPDQLVLASDFFTTVIIIAAFLGIMTVYVLTFPKFRSEQVMAAFFSFVYAPILMAFVYRSRTLPYGLFMYALIFVCSSVCDTCALAAGMMFGKHKMAPVLSPKKTIEGAVGGLLGSAVCSVILAYILRSIYPEADYRIQFLIIGVCGALISMIGDLAASAIKRNHNIKDYGNLIPGHGGIMDRFDSIIFTAPLIYILGVILMGTAAL